MRRRFAIPDHVLGNRGLRNIDTEFQKFAMDSRRSPKHVHPTHGVIETVRHLKRVRALSGELSVRAPERRFVYRFHISTPETGSGKLHPPRFTLKEFFAPLESGFDSDELLQRPGIELITVGPDAIR